jgi:hypothetical protein
MAEGWLSLMQIFLLLYFFEQSFSTFSLERKGGAKSSSEFDAELVAARTFILPNSRLEHSF